AASRYHSWRRLRRLSGFKGSQHARARTTACREADRARTMPILQNARPKVWEEDKVGKRCRNKAAQRDSAVRRRVVVAMTHLLGIGLPIVKVAAHHPWSQPLFSMRLTAPHA